MLSQLQVPFLSVSRLGRKIELAASEFAMLRLET